MRYDTILFDADGTLLDFHKSEKEAVHAMNEIALRGFSAFYAVSANNGGAT